MRATNGNVVVKVGSTMMDKIGSIFLDKRFDKHAKVVITGEVVMVPEFNNNEIIGEEYEGIPRRSAPSKKIRANEFPCEMKVGDRAYFHYLTLEREENFFKFEEGKQLYRVSSADIFCFVRDGKIIMNLNYLLGQPYWREDLEDLGDGVRGKTKDIAGQKIVTDIALKPDYDQAWLRHVGPGVHSQRLVDKGDIVFLTPNSEFENEIEGNKYWVFKHEDVIAVKRGDFVLPLNEWALIQTDPLLESALDHKKDAIGFSGVIVAFGNKPYIPVKRGDRVIFSHIDIRIMLSNLILCKTSNIQCHETQR